MKITNLKFPSHALQGRKRLYGSLKVNNQISGLLDAVENDLPNKGLLPIIRIHIEVCLKHTTS